MNAFPMVALTSQVATTAISTDAFQEADNFPGSRCRSPGTATWCGAADLPQVTAGAFYIASTGRPGPVPGRYPRRVGRPVRLSR